MKTNKKWYLRLASVLTVCALALGAHSALATGSITSQLDVGSRGNGVTSLQGFLASNPFIYSEGLVTGYFGTLTEDAVRNFQVAYDLPNVGRVGPLTLATLNRVMNAGHGLDISAPSISGLAVNLSSRQANISWNTNEAATAKVFYDTHKMVVSETSRSFSEPVISSAYVVTSSDLSTYHNIALPNLNPGTQYHYIVESIDASGNVTVTSEGVFNINY